MDIELKHEFMSPYGNLVRERGKLLHFSEGQEIIRQGQVMPGLMLVSLGVVGAFANIGDGQKRFLYPVLHGMSYGPFPTGENRSDATLEALTDVYLFVLDSKTFTRLMRTHEKFIIMVGEIVNRTLSTNANLLLVSRLPVARDRIQKLLEVIFLLQPFMGPEAHLPIDQRVSQSLLAEMTNVSRSYYNQVSKEIKKRYNM